MKTVDLSAYRHHPEVTKVRPLWVRLSWFMVNAAIFNTSLLPFSKLKVVILRFYGAKIAEGVVIKPRVNIKYPWKLQIGRFTWIGEGVWIDNLDQVTIGANVCISQAALLLCGNHDYKSPLFDLSVLPITIEDGVWIGAKSIVCPGVVCRSHSVLSLGSVASKDLDAYSIYRGNPAVWLKKREIC